MLECRLKTGRTHQIRVHMACIHHPVAGDPVYGPHNCITSLHGRCLQSNAKTLGFIHPITGSSCGLTLSCRNILPIYCNAQEGKA